MIPDDREDAQASAHPRFVALRTALWRLLPPPVRRYVPATFVGFCVLNLFTFSVDLGLLAVLYRGVGLPNAVSVTIAYAVAFSLAFVLNRWLNFESHLPAGPQTVRYVLVVAVNYLAIILGIGAGLIALGVPFQWARITAGLVEAVYMYSAMRWFVFADRSGRRAA
ncbi:GtrA family protein [Actinomycetota bacterium]